MRRFVGEVLQVGVRVVLAVQKNFMSVLLCESELLTTPFSGTYTITLKHDTAMH